MKYTVLALALIVSLFSSPKAFAKEGGMGSSGGDFVTTQENTWFIGGAPVRYCIQKSKDFSAGLEFSRTAIQTALSDWISTLRKLRPEPLRHQFSDGEDAKNMTLSFVEEACSKSTELVFALGTFPEGVRGQVHQHRVAGAVQTSYNKRTGRVNGIVWLSPDMGKRRYLGPTQFLGFPEQKTFWNFKQRLLWVLMHETGHIFGFNHRSGFVMDEDIPANAVMGTYDQGVMDAVPTSSHFAHRKWLRFFHETVSCANITSGNYTEQVLSFIGADPKSKSVCITKPEGNLPLSLHMTFFDMSKNPSGHVVFNHPYRTVSNTHNITVHYKEDTDFLNYAGWYAGVLLEFQTDTLVDGTISLKDGTIVPVRLIQRIHDTGVTFEVFMNGQRLNFWTDDLIQR